MRFSNFSVFCHLSTLNLQRDNLLTESMQEIDSRLSARQALAHLYFKDLRDKDQLQEALHDASRTHVSHNVWNSSRFLIITKTLWLCRERCVEPMNLKESSQYCIAYISYRFNYVFEMFCMPRCSSNHVKEMLFQWKVIKTVVLIIIKLMITHTSSAIRQKLSLRVRSVSPLETKNVSVPTAFNKFSVQEKYL